ncbi:asparaginyl-tRNA synthetase [Abortiporus biennis]|nr:asparaginyl-tRNA synthetase [Abortiporus biennis]
MFSRRLFSSYNPRRSYATTLPPTIKQLLASPSAKQQDGQAKPQPQKVEVTGWVRSIRRHARISFAMITDGSTEKNLQAVVDTKLTKGLTNGVSVRLTGTLSDSPGPGQDKELVVENVECLGECDPEEYPIQKKALTVDYLRDHCHLRTRTAENASMVRLRHTTLKSLQDYFDNEGFCYAHTPITTANDCEGAGEAFLVTAPGIDEPASSTSSPAPSHFFGRPAYLTVSSQLHLEALASSISRVYTISPAFRAERSHTGRHLAEFWMLEAEWAFTRNVDDVCDVVEDSLKFALEKASENSKGDLNVLWGPDATEKLKILESAKDEAKKWTRMSYTEAVKELDTFYAQAKNKPFEIEPKWGRSLGSEHERWIAEELVEGPVFVKDYPETLKPFYMRANEDGNTVGCFDLLVPGLGELVGGSVREERYDVLKKKLENAGLKLEDYDWYLDLRKYGGAPHGGFGVGFERLVKWMSGVENIRECIPMPRWQGRMLL